MIISVLFLYYLMMPAIPHLIFIESNYSESFSLSFRSPSISNNKHPRLILEPKPTQFTISTLSPERTLVIQNFFVFIPIVPNRGSKHVCA